MLISSKTELQPIDYRAAFPATSFPSEGPNDDFLSDHGYARVSLFKAHDAATQKLVPTQPYLEGDFVYTVAVQSKTAEELAAEHAAQAQALQASIVQATQARLDAFARTRQYDDIKSASTYSGCSVTKFDVEGTYCKNIRAETWNVLFNVLGEVEAGTRQIPTSFADVEPLLPILAWPN